MKCTANNDDFLPPFPQSNLISSLHLSALTVCQLLTFDWLGENVQMELLLSLIKEQWKKQESPCLLPPANSHYYGRAYCYWERKDLASKFVFSHTKHFCPSCSPCTSKRCLISAAASNISSSVAHKPSWHSDVFVFCFKYTEQDISTLFKFELC